MLLAGMDVLGSQLGGTGLGVCKRIVRGGRGNGRGRSGQGRRGEDLERPVQWHGGIRLWLVSVRASRAVCASRAVRVAFLAHQVYDGPGGPLVMVLERPAVGDAHPAGAQVALELRSAAAHEARAAEVHGTTLEISVSVSPLAA